MKFNHKMDMKAKLSKESIKNGIEIDKGQFDGLKPDECKLITKYNMIGKYPNGEPYVIVLTGYALFENKVKGE